MNTNATNATKEITMTVEDFYHLEETIERLFKMTTDLQNTLGTAIEIIHGVADHLPLGVGRSIREVTSGLENEVESMKKNVVLAHIFSNALTRRLKQLNNLI